MAKRFEEGARVVCTEDEWFNAFGDKHEVVCRGFEGRVVSYKVVNSQHFIELDTMPDNWFWQIGFTRRLDA